MKKRDEANRNTTHSYSISPHFHHQQQHPRTLLLVHNLAKNQRKVTPVLLVNRLPFSSDPMAQSAPLVLVLDHRHERRRHQTIIILTRRNGAVSAPPQVPCRVNNPYVHVGRQHVIVRNIVVIMIMHVATGPTNRFPFLFRGRGGRYRTFLPRIISRPHPPHPQH